MWAVLKFDIPSQFSPFGGVRLPSSSTTPDGIVQDMEQDQTLEISVTATLLAVMINSAQATMRDYLYKATTSPEFPNDEILRDIIVPPADSLISGTHWLWTDASDFPNMANGEEFPPVPTVGDHSEGVSM